MGWPSSRKFRLPLERWHRKLMTNSGCHAISPVKDTRDSRPPSCSQYAHPKVDDLIQPQIRLVLNRGNAVHEECLSYRSHTRDKTGASMSRSLHRRIVPAPVSRSLCLIQRTRMPYHLRWRLKMQVNAISIQPLCTFVRTSVRTLARSSRWSTRQSSIDRLRRSFEGGGPVGCLAQWQQHAYVQRIDADKTSTVPRCCLSLLVPIHRMSHLAWWSRIREGTDLC
jgi:hypothetical protein